MPTNAVDLLDVVHVCPRRMLPSSLKGRAPPFIESCFEPGNPVSLSSPMLRNKVEVRFVLKDGGAFMVVACT